MLGSDASSEQQARRKCVCVSRWRCWECLSEGGGDIETDASANL